MFGETFIKIWRRTLQRSKYVTQLRKLSNQKSRRITQFHSTLSKNYSEFSPLYLQQGYTKTSWEKIRKVWKHFQHSVPIFLLESLRSAFGKSHEVFNVVQMCFFFSRLFVHLSKTLCLLTIVSEWIPTFKLQIITTRKAF